MIYQDRNRVSNDESIGQNPIFMMIMLGLPSSLCIWLCHQGWHVALQMTALSRVEEEKTALQQQLAEKAASAISSQQKAGVFEQRVEAEVKERTKTALRKAMQLGQERVSHRFSAMQHACS